MDRVTALLAKAYPQSNKGWGASVEPLKNDFFPKERQLIFWLLLGAVTFVLLIACVNVANMLLAKGMSRQKEVAVRVALGATRGTIFAQQLIESLVLAIIGGLLGVGAAYGILRGIVALIPVDYLPLEADLRLNIPILLFTLASTTLAGLLFGCAPAWYASRLDPGENLKEGGRAGIGKGHRRLGRILVVGEFALALVLLAGAGLAIHSFLNLQRVDLGVRTDHILTFYLPVLDTRPKDPESVVTYYRQILDNIAAVPGVSHATATTGVPVEGSGDVPFTIAGRPEFADPKQRPNADFRSVTPDYFPTFGIRIMKGHPFGPQDTASSLKVAMVNEEFVNRFLKGTDPLQQRLLIPQMSPGVEKSGPPLEWQIVGVFNNVRGWDFNRYYPEIVVPFWQSPWPQAGIGLRTSGDPAAMTKSIAAAVHAVDPEVALAFVRTMEQVRNERLEGESFNTVLFGAFAGMALLLAAFGIYGVMAFSVAQRTHEMGVRIALGASARDVLRLVLGQALLTAGVGVAIGIAGAFVLTRTMQSLLFGVSATDPATFAGVALLLTLVAFLASYLPARRATKVDPMVALRYE